MKEEVESQSRRRLMGEKRLVSVKEAAHYLACSPMTIRRSQWNGNLTYVRIGRRILFDLKDLDEFIQKMKIDLIS